MKEASYGRTIDNLKQMMYQAPYDERLNNELKTLIVIKLLREMDKADESFSTLTLWNNRGISNKWRFLNYLQLNVKVPQCPMNYLRNIGFVNTTAFDS